MDMATPKLIFRNQRDRLLTIMLEPWGEDYWIQPGDEFEFVPESPKEGFYFAVVEHTDYVAIYAEGGCGYVAVLSVGQKIECGHNRPSDAFKT
jgi:hypothetical protein